MVLTHLSQQCSLEFVLAHCNFQLRGGASDADEKLVKQTANGLGIEYVVTHFDTVGYMNKNKVSLQIAARDLRYHWFAELMQELNIKTLVTAHHSDDNLETFIINLSRGTGITGLTGIPERTEYISRPLLAFSRAQILEYAQQEKIQWREDSSNGNTKYLRNKVRHEIVPLLKELHPTFLDNFEMTRAHLSDTASLTENYLARLSTELFEKENGHIRISIHKLQSLHPLKAYLYGLFEKFGFTAWNDIALLLTAMSGKEVHSKTHRLIKDREFLLLVEKLPKIVKEYQIHEHEDNINTPVRLSIAQVDSIEETGRAILYTDKETLKYPLTVRKWCKGDYFYPLGMKGKKKLAKFFKDEKIDVASKHEQWLLCSGKDIVWVIGKRPDERFKVTQATTQITKFVLNE